MSEKKQTAAEWLGREIERRFFVSEHRVEGPRRAVWADVAEKIAEKYGCLCAEEAVAAKEAELRCEEADDWIRRVWGPNSLDKPLLFFRTGLQRLANIAKQHGIDKGKAAVQGILDDTLKLLDQAQAERDHAKEVVLQEWRATDVEAAAGIKTYHYDDELVAIRVDRLREVLAMARTQKAEP